MDGHFAWVTCRAAGVAALILVSASVGVGLSMTGRLVRSSRGADLRVIHEALSIAALAMIALHALSLLADSYFHPTIADLAIPFERNYREPYMGIGIIGGWATIVLGLSVYVRQVVRMPWWKVLHRCTVLAWVMSVVHALGEGSDRGEGWFIAVVVVTIVPTVVVIFIRVSAAGRPRGRM